MIMKTNYIIKIKAIKERSFHLLPLAPAIVIFLSLVMYLLVYSVNLLINYRLAKLVTYQFGIIP